MVVADPAAAQEALGRLSYYRLAAYFLVFQIPGDATHHFRPGTRFADALALYEFDEALRRLFFQASSTIEIALRARMVYHGALAHGPHWFTQPQRAADPNKFARNLAEIDYELGRAHEVFLDHYRRTYTPPARPPAWMTLEVVSFGLLSKILRNLAPAPFTKAIAAEFGLDESILQSWITALCSIRNVCAHHGRLWNRILTRRPRLPTRPRRLWLAPVPGGVRADRVYVMAAVCAYLLDRITPQHTFKADLRTLLAGYPQVPLRSMGFSTDWTSDPFWQ